MWRFWSIFALIDFITFNQVDNSDIKTLVFPGLEHHQNQCAETDMSLCRLDKLPRQFTKWYTIHFMWYFNSGDTYRVHPAVYRIL